MMKPVSDALRGLLSRQGMHDRKAGTLAVVLNEGRGAASDGALSQVKASNLEGGLGYSPIGRQGGGWQPMENSGKGPGVNAPAKFDSLRIVIDNSRNGRAHSPRVSPPGARPFLVLVQ